MMANKNNTYQTRSKYKSKIFNIYPLGKYLSNESTKIIMYNFMLNKILYTFTSNASKKSYMVDESFTRQTNN